MVIPSKWLETITTLTDKSQTSQIYTKLHKKVSFKTIANWAKNLDLELVIL